LPQEVIAVDRNEFRRKVKIALFILLSFAAMC
jgi:hypothetical protein